MRGAGRMDDRFRDEPIFDQAASDGTAPTPAVRIEGTMYRRVGGAILQGTRACAEEWHCAKFYWLAVIRSRGSIGRSTKFCVSMRFASNGGGCATTSASAS